MYFNRIGFFPPLSVIWLLDLPGEKREKKTNAHLLSGPPPNPAPPIPAPPGGGNGPPGCGGLIADCCPPCCCGSGGTGGGGNPWGGMRKSGGGKGIPAGRAGIGPPGLGPPGGGKGGNGMPRPGSGAVHWERGSGLVGVLRDREGKWWKGGWRDIRGIKPAGAPFGPPGRPNGGGGSPPVCE